VVQTAKEVPQVSRVAPAHWFSRNDFMHGGQCVVRSDPWAATERAREKILLVDCRQNVGDAALEDTIADAWHPEWA